MTCKDCIHAEVCLDICGFMSFELKGMGGDCEHFADKSLCIMLPCYEGDTIYRIVKFCESNTGYKESFIPSIEFENDCEFFETIYGDCAYERCNAEIDNDKDCWNCSFNLDILCEKCKERLAIQKDIFNLSKVRQIFNTPMFYEYILPEDICYLSLEEAEAALEERKRLIE